MESLTLFRELTPAQLAEAQAVMRPLDVPANYELISPEDEDSTVYIVVRGSLKVCAGLGSDETIVALRGPGEVLGEMSALDGAERSARVVTLERSSLLCVSRVDFWSVLWEMPPLAYALTCLLTQRVRVLTAQLHAMAKLDVPGRLARQIVLLADEFGVNNGEIVEIPFHLTQSELGHSIGATREQVNKLLRVWTRNGLIDSRDGDGRLLVRNRTKLEAFYRTR